MIVIVEMVYMELNKIIFQNFIETNPNWLDLKFNDNILNYNGSELNLEGYSLAGLFSKYSPILNYQDTLSSLDLFSIIRLHQLAPEFLQEQERFYQILKKGDIDDSEVSFLNKYNSFLFETLKYQDFLLTIPANILTRLYVAMETIRIEGKMTKNEALELAKFDEMNELAIRYQTSKIKKNEQALKLSKTGYVNIFLTTTLIILVGITITLTIIFT